MKAPAIHRKNLPPAVGEKERGITIILVALSMIGILAMAALSIDVVTLYLARLEAQRSADAAALTAARLLSVSGITGDPNDSTDSRALICGGETSPASQAAQAVAYQNTVSGVTPSTITVKYSAGADSSEDCSGLPAAFGVNPMVTVQVQRTGLPSFFSRLWRAPSQTVTATATAEVFNSSNSENVGNSGASGTITPVQPRCVKPLIVPNLDPGNAPNPFVNADSSIQNKGIQLSGGGAGVIGESFALLADCSGGPGGCSPPKDNQPLANVTGGGYVGGAAPALNNLEYLPGAVPASSQAVPSCGDDSSFQEAIAGCDETTVYQCGVASASATTPNRLDLSNNPGGGGGDTAAATQCLIHQGTRGPAPPDADSLDTTAFPFKIRAGSGNPVTGVRGSLVSASNSIITLPIYDGAPLAGTTPAVTIVGFLQVFINYVGTNGRLHVTVLNVAGCGNGTLPTGSPVLGSSPVPVRLITPPS